jgi:serine/threonine protein kinase
VGSALLRQGQRINSALVVDRRLGEGAFAEVYRVRHHILGWQALKLFKHVASLEATSRMLDEARILSTLGHPNIIWVFDAGTVRTSEGVRGYITMEYVEGGSLERLVESHAGVVPVGEVTAVLRQAAEGVAVAHERPHPIVHRDLSLANVLITYDETGLRVKVSDFGLAKETDPGTMAASAQGTVACMPPEALRWSSGPLSSRSRSRMTGASPRMPTAAPRATSPGGLGRGCRECRPSGRGPAARGSSTRPGP